MQVMQQFELRRLRDGIPAYETPKDIFYKYKCCILDFPPPPPPPPPPFGCCGPFFMVEAGTWDKVRDRCLMEGGDLASILSKQEAVQAAQACPHMKCYIGLTRGGPGQPFFWLDGSPVNYTAWSESEPQSGDTVVIWTDRAGGSWNDWGQGGDTYPGVCKKSQRTVNQKCSIITSCEECLISRDPTPEVASDCVPIRPADDGSTCMPKRYIEQNKDILRLKPMTDCNVPSSAADEIQFLSGSIPFPSFNAPKCVNALFPNAFLGVEDSRVHVLATISHASSQEDKVHEPTSVWIEGISTLGFTVCVSETNTMALLQGSANQHDDRLAVDYFAYSSQPLPGTRIGTVKVSNGFTGVHCTQLQFVPAFRRDSVPKIVATANHRTSRNRHVVKTVWFEDITSISAKVCVAVPKNSGPQDSSTEIDYLAWIDMPKTIDQGVVAFEAYKWENKLKASTCKVVKFNKGWVYAPEIQVGLNFRGYDGSAPHEAMTVWIEYVNKDSFQICAAQLADRYDKKGDNQAFNIDWFASGSIGCPPGEMLTSGTTLKVYYLTEAPITVLPVTPDLAAMPDLSALTPSHIVDGNAIRYTSRLDFEKILPDFPSEVAASWQGIAYIQKPDIYQFRIESDGDVNLAIDGVLVVDMVGGSGTPKRGEIRLAAGMHNFRADWWTRKKMARIIVLWRGADTRYEWKDFVGSRCSSRKPLDAQIGLRPGFHANGFFFNRKVENMPDVTIRIPDVSAVVQTLNFRSVESWRKVVAPSFPEQDFAVVFNGVFYVELNGDYMFGSRSDAGSHIYIDGIEVVSHGGLHSADIFKTGTITLTRGYHFIKVAYFERSGISTLQVVYSGPDTKNKEEGISGYYFASVSRGAIGKLWYLDSDTEFVGMPNVVTDRSLAYSNMIQSPEINFQSAEDFQLRVADFPGERFAGVWKGDFEIIVEGEYFFYLTSRDGSRLWVDGRNILNNEGKHDTKTEQGSALLMTGIHSYEVTYWDDVNTPLLSLQYKGKDTRNSRSFLKPVYVSTDAKRAKLSPGFDAAIYFFSEQLTHMPNIESRTPKNVVTDTINFGGNMDFEVLAKDWSVRSAAAVVFSGIFIISKPGLYTFSCTSANGSHVWIDGNMFIDNGGQHGELEKRGSIPLMAGYHTFKADFYKSTSDPAFIITYEGPDTEAEYKPLRGVHFSPPPPPLNLKLEALMIDKPPDGGWCAKWFLSPYGANLIHTMPWLDRIIPQKVETIQDLDLEGVDAFKRVSAASYDRLAAKFSGVHTFEKAGMYKLCLTTSSTASLKLNDEWVVRVNAKSEGRTEGEVTTACKELMLDGKQTRIDVEFFENGVNPQIKVTYSCEMEGIDCAEKVLPSEGFNRESCVLNLPACECGSGWCSEWWFNPKGSMRLEDFSDLSDLKPQVAKRINGALEFTTGWDLKRIGGFQQSDDLPVAEVHFEGYVYIQKSGEYIICTESSDGSRVIMDGTVVVEAATKFEDTEFRNDYSASDDATKSIGSTASKAWLGDHQKVWWGVANKKCASVVLRTGSHLTNVTYFENGEFLHMFPPLPPPKLVVTYSGPDTGCKPNPMRASWHSMDKCGVDPNLKAVADQKKAYSYVCEGGVLTPSAEEEAAAKKKAEEAEAAAAAAAAAAKQAEVTYGSMRTHMEQEKRR